MKRLNLVFIGDSLTDYGDWDSLLPEYRVINLGVSGETVEGLLQRFGEVAAAVVGADYLLIMTGINNIASDDFGFFGAYRALVRRIAKGDRVRVVVQSLLPAILPMIETDAIEKVNRQLLEIARTEGAEFLDIYSRFLTDGGPQRAFFSEDGVHLSWAGYKAWAEAVREFLRSATGYS